MNTESIFDFFSSAGMTVLVFLFLGVSIFVHEFGHFLAARARGLKVERFSIGFGPKIWGWKGKDGVDYRLSLIPLGGYVALPQLADMREIEGGGAPQSAAPLPKLSYADKFWVLIAGAGFNLLFALALSFVVWGWGRPVSADDETTTIGYIVPEMALNARGESAPSPALRAGLKPGDRVLAVDGEKVRRFSEISAALMTGSGRTADGRPQAVLDIERGGEKLRVEVEPVLVEINSSSRDAVRKIGVAPKETLQAGAVAAHSPAEKAGLQAGDVLKSVDGKPLLHSEELFAACEDAAQSGRELELEIERAGQTQTLRAGPVFLPVSQELAKLRFKLKNGREYELLFFPVDAVLAGAKGAGLSAAPSRAALFALEGDLPPSLQSEQFPLDGVFDFVCGEPLVSLEQFVRVLNRNAKAGAAITLGAGGETFTLEGELEAVLEPQKRALLGIVFARPVKIAHRNPIEQFSDTLRMMKQTLVGLASPKSDVDVRMLSGPVGILRVYYRLLSVDLRHVLWFTVLININLAILNLLPLPVLDGGHLFFATFEKIIRRPIPVRVLAWVNGVFMLLLLGLIVYITAFDGCRWHGDTQGERLGALRAQMLLPAEFTSPAGEEVLK